MANVISEDDPDFAPRRTLGLKRAFMTIETCVRTSMPARLFVCILFVLAAVLPVLLVDHPAGIDAKNHLARHAVGLAKTMQVRGEPLSAPQQAMLETYDHEIRMVPNVGGDVFMALVSPLVGVEQAAKWMLVVSFALFVGGALVFYRTLHGAWSLWPLVAVPLVWNSSMAWGFENYVLAIGPALLAFAFWIAKRDGPTKLALTASFAVFIYFGHIIAFALLGLLVGSWELRSVLADLTRSPLAALRKAAALAFIFIPPLLHFAYVNSTLSLGRGGQTIFGDLATRMGTLISPVRHHADDTLSMFVLFGLIGLLWLAIRSASARFDMRMALPVLFLVLCALAMPSRISGVALMDVRLPVVALLLVIVSHRFHAGRGIRSIAAVTSVALLALTVAPVVQYWRTHDAIAADLRRGFEAVPIGARVLSARAELSHPALRHAVGYATLDRGAFVPELFTGASPLTVRSHLRHLDRPVPASTDIDVLLDRWRNHRTAPATAHWHRWWQDFDYIYVWGEGGSVYGDDGILELVHRSNATAIYRVVKSR